MEALNDLVSAGKVRALGASAMYASQFQDMQKVAQDNGWTPFSAMENHYNLLYREDEKDPIPLCNKTNVSLMPYSPLAVDLLARTVWTADTLRNATDKVSRGKYERAEDNDLPIIDPVQNLAERHNVPMARIAIAWQWAKGIASPIIGGHQSPASRRCGGCARFGAHTSGGLLQGGALPAA